MGENTRGITIRRVDDRRAIDQFIRFQWRIYGNDPYWVPPLISLQREKLDPAINPFWHHAERTLFMAMRDGEPVGTIAAIVDHNLPVAASSADGVFGFFECVDDPEVARALLDAAGEHLRTRGRTRMIGPYNPTGSDDFGVLIEGFETRPSLMEGHSPRYYAALMESAGMVKLKDAYAWLVTAPPGATRAEDLLPKRMATVVQSVRKHSGVHTRAMDVTRWDAEVETVCRLFNESLATVPEFVPLALAEFRVATDAFRSFVVPDLVRFVEVEGKPVAFALAVPDINEALQVANGRLFPTGALRIWWKKRHMKRASFKILGVLPKYRHRGYDAMLVLDVAQAILDHGFTEADLSMTGEENTKINVYLEALGLKIYRRNRVYVRSLSAS
ncbi:MAG: hypothetical protein WCJ30_16125 [Deltaproteobacteria bacterium]